MHVPLIVAMTGLELDGSFLSKSQNRSRYCERPLLAHPRRSLSPANGSFSSRTAPLSVALLAAVKSRSSTITCSAGGSSRIGKDRA